MTRDLEETLDGLGRDCRAVVDRLVAGAEVDFAPGHRAFAVPTHRPSIGRPLLAAASLVIFAGFMSVFLQSDEPRPAMAESAHEYRLAELSGGADLEEMIRTQNADGSWRSDFLTRRNAAALAKCVGPRAKVAYKKAMRNLRVRGLL